MKKVIAAIEGISQVGGYVSGLFMVLIVLLIVVEIVARTVFNASTMISDEYSAYFFVAVVMSGLAFSMKEGAHIRISIIRSRLSRQGQRILDLVVLLIALVLACFALYYAVLMTYDVWDLEMTADSISETPIFIPQLVIPVGLLLFILQLASGFLRRLLSSPTR